MTLEVRLHRFAAGVNGVERREKILGYVARGEEFENVGVEPQGPRKGPKNFLKNCFLKKVCENTYVGAPVKIGIVDRTTTMVGWWTPPS